MTRHYTRRNPSYSEGTKQKRIERVKQILQENIGHAIKTVILESMKDPLLTGISISVVNSYFFDLFIEGFFNCDTDGIQITNKRTTKTDRNGVTNYYY